MTPDSISVIVPMFNGADLIGPCLASIPSGVEVIVVDDLSTDDSVQVVANDFSHAILVRNEANRGFGATANRGLALASRPIRVVLNSDARLTPGALDALGRAFDQESVGVAGPRLVFPDGSHQVSAASFPRPTSVLAGSFLLNDIYRMFVPNGRFPWELGMARRDHDSDRDVDWVEGACLAIREECLREIGGFDENYYMFAEETDLCWRARQAGWTVRYVAGAIVTHIGGASGSDLAKRANNELRSEARFMVRAYGERVLPRWRAARAIGAVAKATAFALAGLVDARARARRQWQVSALRFSLGREWRPERPLAPPRFSSASKTVGTLSSPPNGPRGDVSRPAGEPVDPTIYDEEYFLTCAAGYDRWEQSEGMHLHSAIGEALESANLQDGMRVLDVGSGRGELVLNAARRGATSVGIDYSEGALALAARARRLHPDLQARTCFAKADAKTLPYPDETFDRVFMFDVVEHLHPWELDASLREVRRVLRPSGSLLIHTMPNLWFYSYVYPPLRIAARVLHHKVLPRDPRVPEERSMHVNEQSPRALASSLRRAGLKADISFSGYVRSPLNPGIADRIVRAIGRQPPLRRFASFNIFAVATRA